MRIGLVLVVAATASAAAAPRAGRVVRVERTLQRAPGNPRFCAIPTITPLLAYCFGVPPAIGDAIEVIDTHHHVGRVHATHVDAVGTCKGGDNLWQVQTEVDGTLATDVDAHEIAGLIDVPIDARHAHLVKVDHPPPGMASMEMAFGVDSDGDGRVDVEFVLAQCDDPGARGHCFDVWLDPDGRSPQRLHREAFPEGCF